MKLNGRPIKDENLVQLLEDVCGARSDTDAWLMAYAKDRIVRLEDECDKLGDVYEDALDEVLTVRSERDYSYRDAANLRALLSRVRDFIADQYTDEEAAALEGHHISKCARDLWDDVCEAIAKDEEDSKS